MFETAIYTPYACVIKEQNSLCGFGLIFLLILAVGAVIYFAVGIPVMVFIIFFIFFFIFNLVFYFWKKRIRNTSILETNLEYIWVCKG
jgi:uncharacterized membrane protein